RSVHGRHLCNECVPAVGTVIDDHVHSSRRACARGPGGKLHARRRRAGGLHADGRSGDRPHRHRDCSRRGRHGCLGNRAARRGAVRCRRRRRGQSLGDGNGHGAGRRRRLAAGGPRSRGERQVAHMLWRTANFQRPTSKKYSLEQFEGYTFVELIVVVTILLILASAVLPLAQVTAQRQREVELRRELREIRMAIDKFKDAVDVGQIPTTELKPDNEGYPPDLETLVEGVSAANDATGRKLKYLRRIPIDPMTNSMEWGLRSYQDKPDTTSWGGQNVFDVFTKSGATALDGTKYRDW